MRLFVVAASLLLSFAAFAQEFTPEKRDSRSAFPELTIADFKKAEDILKVPFPLLARWNTEMLSDKPDFKICAELRDSSAKAIAAIPKAPKQSVKFVVKNGLEMIQGNQAYILKSMTLNLRDDVPEAKAAKTKANNQRVLQNMRSHLRQVAMAFDGVPGFELKELRAGK